MCAPTHPPTPLFLFPPPPQHWHCSPTHSPLATPTLRSSISSCNRSRSCQRECRVVLCYCVYVLYSRTHSLPSEVSVVPNGLDIGVCYLVLEAKRVSDCDKERETDSGSVLHYHWLLHFTIQCLFQHLCSVNFESIFFSAPPNIVRGTIYGLWMEPGPPHSTTHGPEFSETD